MKKYRLVLLITLVLLVLTACSSQNSSEAQSAKPLSHDELTTFIRNEINNERWESAADLCTENYTMLIEDKALVSEAFYQYALKVASTTEDKIKWLSKVDKSTEFYSKSINETKGMIDEFVKTENEKFKASKLAKSNVEKLSLLQEVVADFETISAVVNDDKKIEAAMKKYTAEIKSVEKKIAEQKAAANRKVKVRVTLVNAYISYNDSVGNEWYYYSEVNSSKYEIGQSKTFSILPSGKIHLYSEAYEEDSWVDVGSDDSYIKVSELKKGKAKIKKTSVIVTENRGRYSGNQAEWIFIYRITKL